MTILIADQPGTNSYLSSLINAYKNAGMTVICGVHNFFYSNFLPDVLHLQWPEKLYDWYPFSALNESEKEAQITERLRFYKSHNVKIVHTIHNLKPHQSNNPDFTEKIFRLVINYSDILVHHGNNSISLLENVYNTTKDKLSIVCSHGDYLMDFRSVSKKEARKKLGIPDDKFVILNFGNQTRYKNERFLESVFRKLKIRNKYLLTAGNFRNTGFTKSSQLFNFFKTRFRMFIKYPDRKYFYKVISPLELPFFINSADIFLLGHNGNNLNSGILPMAATYAKPVVFPNLGCFREQMDGWVYETYNPNNIGDAVKAVSKLYDRIKDQDKKFDNSDWLLNNSWDKHVNNILNTVKRYTKVNNDLF